MDANNLRFYGKKNAHITSSSGADVSIKLCKKDPNKGQRVALTIRNNSYKKITRTGYVVFAIDGNRLYIAAAGPLNGYKLVESKSNIMPGTRYVQFYIPSITAWAANHGGNYRLNLDKECGLYYVDANAAEKNITFEDLLGG